MKITISSIFDTTKLVATKSGQELRDLITTFADFVKQVVPSLANGLTFADNFNAEAKVVELSSDVEQVVSTAKGKAVTDIMVGRVISDVNLITGFLWWENASGDVVVKATFNPAPASPVNVRLLVFYA